MDGVCDLGIVGENVLLEAALERDSNNPNYTAIKKLGFGRCRLSIAFPKDKSFSQSNCLSGLRIATSYPYLLQQYLDNHKIDANVLTISGSVEIAPRLNMADAICDLVSSGRTLEENNLTEVETLIHSQSLLIQSNNDLGEEKQATIELLLRRINGVLKAQDSKYIMFHAPKSALAAIKDILPGSESPTIMPLDGDDDKVAIHVVSPEAVFWDTLEKLKSIGASAILVLPIEKMLY